MKGMFQCIANYNVLAKQKGSSCCFWFHLGTKDAMYLLLDCNIARDVWCSAGLQDVVRVMNNDTIMTVIKRVTNVVTRE